MSVPHRLPNPIPRIACLAFAGWIVTGALAQAAQNLFVSDQLSVELRQQPGDGKPVTGQIAAGTPVEISLATDGTLRVINTGAIVPADTLAQLRGRFVRSNTDASGTGLGLAIADTIASGAGARLTLQSPATGRPDGFEAIVNIIAS